MDKAKAAVGSFLNRDGKHDTTVHETVNPAVTNEHVTRTQQEEVTTAIDREVHQDHYHTSVQPIKDREVLPEQHSHQMAGVQTREVKHGNDDHVKQRLESEAAQFKNTREVGDTQHSKVAAPTIAGEHVHHHVHEAIQPVIQKETIQPSVVHTTVPIKEIHQNEAKHHNASSLPAVTMDEFKRQGGHLTGREERTDAFAGEPRSVGGTLGGAGADGTTSLTQKDGHHHNSHGTTGAAIGSTTSHGSHDSHNSSTHKPSLLDKLNPKKDANGDGKAGFMKVSRYPKIMVRPVQTLPQSLLQVVKNVRDFEI
ncbi:hypothetical protein VTL71DRAFT_13187 [Oculimacula yallundae]|uniref:Allergen n=1 Tax=Oculimacula yallundae TaxID=86028 RepID=A0ABR4CKY8_9HELO